MAKYVISSIPASLPINQDGGLFKKKKKKKLNSMMDYTPPTDESTLVRGIEPQNTFGNYFNSPGIPTSDYKPYNVGEEDYTRLRSEVEKIPFTDRAANELERCDPNNPNSVWFNGECMTEEEYLPLYKERNQKERDEFDNKRKARHQKLLDEYSKRDEEYIDKYTNTFKKSKKSDKIEPFKTIDKSELDKVTNDGITLRELYSKVFFISKSDKYGKVNLYIKDIMKERIMQNGFRTGDFVKTWGLNKDEVDAEFGPYMEYVDKLYNENRTAEILKLAKKKNITIEAAAKLIPKSVGSQKYINENITNPLNKEIDENFDNQIAIIKDGIKPFKRTNIKQKVNYNFDDDIYETKEKDGVVISHEFNSIRRYTKAWVKAGKDEKERKSRQVQVNAILNKQYPEIKKELDKNPLTRGANLDKTGIVKDASDHVYVNPDVMNNITNNRRTDASNQLTNQKRDGELAELTGYVDDYNIYTQNLMQRQLYDLNVDALDSKNFSSLDKLKFIEGDNEYKEGRIYNEDYQKKIADIFNYDKYVERVTSADQIRPGKSRTPLSLSEKIHDVANYPIDAFEYWMNPRTQMWPDNATSDQGYHDRKKLEKKWQNYGLDLGTIKNEFSPTGLLNFFGQPFNPVKIGTDVYDGYEKNGFTGAGEALANAGYDIADRVLLASTFGASAIGKMAYLRNLSNLNKAAKTANFFGKAGIGVRKFGNALDSVPLTAQINAGIKDYMKAVTPVMAFDAVRPGGNFNQAYNDFSKGDKLDGLGNLALGTFGVGNYIGRGFNLAKKPFSYLNSKIPRLELNRGSKTFGIGPKDPYQLVNTTDDFIRNFQLAGIKSLSNSNMTAAQKLLLEQEMAAGTVVPTFTSTAPNKLVPIFNPDGSMSGADFMKQNYGFNPTTLEMGQVVQPKNIFKIGNTQLQLGQKTYPLNFNEFVPFKPPTGPFNNYGLPINQKGGTPSNLNTKNIVDSLRQLGSLNNYEKGGAAPPKWLTALLKKGASMGNSFKNLFTIPGSVKKAFGYFPPVIPTLPSKTQLIDEFWDDGKQLSGLTEYGSLLDNIDPGGQTLEDSFYRNLNASAKKGFKDDILETMSKARDNSSFKFPNLVDVKDADFTTESPFWMTYANAANLAKTGLDFSYIKPRIITDADYFTFPEIKKQFQGQKKWHTDMMDFKSKYHTRKQKDELREKLKEYGLPYESDQDLFEALYESRPQDFTSKMYKINHLDFLKKIGRYDYLKTISKGEFDSNFPLSFDLKHKYSFADNVDKLPFWHDQSLKVDDNYVSYLNDATTHRDLVDLTTAFDPWWAEGLPKDYYRSGLAGMTDFDTEKSLLLKFIQMKYGKKRTMERLDYQNPKNKYHPLKTDPRGWDPKYLNKTGGVIKNSLTSKKNGITMNLSKSEINKYIAGGYIIEDV